MSTLETLKKAREVISDEHRWTQGAWLTIGREPKYCAVGALQRAAGIVDRNAVVRELNGAESPVVREGAKALARTIGKSSRVAVQNYNDSHSHECVIAMYDAAIEHEEAKETTA